jgi:GNAT superfamily N-acetyltransferase
MEPSGWLLRSSATATARRANSVLAFPTEAYGPEDVEAVVSHYDALGRRPVAAVLADSAPRSFLLDRGWVPESHETDTLFQLASVARACRSLAAVDVSRVVLNLDGPVVTAAIAGEAQGHAACADGWVGFRGIEVDPAHRRQGLARTIMAALLDWGAELGATTAYLQVLGDNFPALALYESMGFVTHHAYAYLTPGSPGSA